ncbi:hypothetical protein LZG74_22720 [Dyadobacter sp. CY327]|uniref:hypothetical protein n=1 Tax=Dyadobacter sp. CY327 TaxID=2907301 RepID=UPI001F19F8BD|nr:hypothetical protein [Dyadobacter sp. CY327]MCE7073148.1 hypothetical protein [Dyadobacter sp. CY327]
MNFKRTLVCGSLMISLLSCNSTTDSSNSSEKSTLKLTFNGKTKTYTDARISDGKFGSIQTIGITAGADGSDYLSLNVYGATAGTYPYKQDMSIYTQVSQVEYKTAGTVFNNYFAQMCPDKSGYRSTIGEIKILEYEAGKHAKGTFSGALIDANGDEQCNPDSISFSGEFDIAVD